MKPPTLAPVPAYVYRAGLVAVHDGDTATFRLDLGKLPYKVEITPAVRVNLLYCPELKEPGGQEALRAAIELLGGAEEIVVATYKPSLTRLVGDVWIDGELYAAVMVARGLGSHAPGAGHGRG